MATQHKRLCPRVAAAILRGRVEVRAKDQAHHAVEESIGYQP
jgi:hypothetical protein